MIVNTGVRHTVSDQREIIVALLREERGMLLRDLAAALEVNTTRAWEYLRPLREAGVVLPPIREGIRGRVEGGPLVYALRGAQARRSVILRRRRERRVKAGRRGRRR